MATQSKFFADLGIKSATNTEIDGNLSVSGNLTVSGTQTTIDSTTKSVADSMIELASGNTTADLTDIGIYGNYNDGLSGESGVSEYTGLFRDATDSTWKLYDGLEVEPTTTVNTSGSGYTLADLQVGDLTATTLTATNTLTGGSMTYPTSDGTDGQVLKTNGSGTLSFGDAASTDGITASGSNTIIQSPDDTSVAYINNTGYFGINHDNPTGRLHVAGHTSSVASIFESNGNGDTVPLQLKVKANNGTTSTQGLFGNAGTASTDNTITLGTNPTTGLTVDNAGRVGIGTASPSSVVGFGNGGVLYLKGDSSNDVSLVLEGQSGSGTRVELGASGGTLQVHTGTGSGSMTERMRILSGGGITFNGDTATANALDDYEEGTWTPAFYTYSGVTTSSISSYAIYTKIGRIVHIHAKITCTLSSLPGQPVIITGLPFTAKDSGDSQQRAIIAVGGDTMNTGGNTPKAHFRTDGSQLQGIYWNASNNTAYWAYNGFDSSTFEMHISGSYTT